MKITIVNQHTNNFGDEAAGIALINELITRYNAEIHIIYNGDGTIHINNKNIYHEVDCKLKYMGYINILLKLLQHNYKGNSTMQYFDNLIKSSDYVLVSPCGANIGIYKDWRFLVRLLFVVFCKKTPIFYLNTIGKSDSILFNCISTYVLKHSKVYVREKKSEEYLKEKHIKCKRGVDTAFLLKTPEKNNNNFGKYIVFVPTNFDKHRNFKGIDSFNFIKNNILEYLCNYATKKKYKIIILPHLNTKEEHYFLNKIKDYIISEYHCNDTEIVNVSTVFEYYDFIRSSQIVFGMRYHTIVLASKANIPFVCLAYENKMVEVSNYMNMEKCCIKMYDKFDKNKIKDVLSYIESNRDKIIETLKNENSLIKEKALIPLEVIQGEQNK